MRLAVAGALTNEADLIAVNGAIEARGDAVDIAFLVLAEKLGTRHTALRKECSEEAAISYESSAGFSASLNRTGDEFVLSMKGAPEIVLPRCAGAASQIAERALHDLTTNGYRVIALAQRDVASAPATLTDDTLKDLEFLGLVGLIDPLRSEAPGAVSEAVAAGVDIRMITGDHPETALAIARQLGPRWSPDTVLTGAALNSLEGDARADAIMKTQVYARVEPAQKTLIVTELQRQGHFVADPFLVCFNNFHTLNCRSETRSAFAIPLSANPLLIASIIGAQGLHVAAMHLPATQALLDLSPVAVEEWIGAVALAASVFVLGEGYKLFIARPRARRAAASTPEDNAPAC